MLDKINSEREEHMITIEDPIEFLHNHKRATFHQRELHSDTPSVAHALRAALRQAPNVIAVGELKDRETMELALEAAETGHLVFCMLNTVDARQTVERFVGAFPPVEQATVRDRLARMLRFVVSQRLVPRQQDGRRVGVFEILKSGSKLMESLLLNDWGNSAAPVEVASTVDAEIEKLVRAGIVNREIALAHAVDPRELSKKLADLDQDSAH